MTAVMSLGKCSLPLLLNVDELILSPLIPVLTSVSERGDIQWELWISLELFSLFLLMCSCLSIKDEVRVFLKSVAYGYFVSVQFDMTQARFQCGRSSRREWRVWFSEGVLSFISHFYPIFQWMIWKHTIADWYHSKFEILKHGFNRVYCFLSESRL